MNADRINFGGRPIRIQEEGEVRTEAEGVPRARSSASLPATSRRSESRSPPAAPSPITDGPDAVPVVRDQPLARAPNGGATPIPSAAASAFGGSETWLRIVGIVGE